MWQQNVEVDSISYLYIYNIYIYYVFKFIYMHTKSYRHRSPPLRKQKRKQNPPPKKNNVTPNWAPPAKKQVSNLGNQTRFLSSTSVVSCTTRESPILQSGTNRSSCLIARFQHEPLFLVRSFFGHQGKKPQEKVSQKQQDYWNLQLPHLIGKGMEKKQTKAGKDSRMWGLVTYFECRVIKVITPEIKHWYPWCPKINNPLQELHTFSKAHHF